MKRSILFYFLSVFLCYVPINAHVKRHQKPPKLTVIMVIDQFAHHYIAKLQPFFQYGFKLLLERGIVYENAYHPHGFPETATGHTTLSTSVVAKNHGIIGNQWLNKQYKKIQAVDDESPEALSFDHEGKALHAGCSAHHIQVDGFSDQFCMHSSKYNPRSVFSVSLKPRAAIGTANKVGKAVWLDEKSGNFTSSKYYFEKLPTWLTRFNEQRNADQMTQISWQAVYPEDHPAYQFPFIRDYEHCAKQSIAPSNNIPIDRTSKNPFEWYSKTPQANQDLLNLATHCLESNLSARNEGNMVLWVCLSPLDLAGHIFGPDSFEIIDQIYHLDRQLQIFMKQIQRRYGKRNVLFALTADHGIQPIQEISYKKGIKNARRIMSPVLIKKMNTFVTEKYKIEDIVVGYECADFCLDRHKLATLSNEHQETLLQDLKALLKAEPGIKQVWTKKELALSYFEPYELEYFYQNSHYEGRSGDLTCMPEPYCLITSYPNGCSHATPYDYDTHVPLVLYRDGSFAHKVIYDKVWITQLSVTLAKLLGVPRPSASTSSELPGVFS